jgi:V8-like Glu-specific endopeptidase
MVGNPAAPPGRGVAPRIAMAAIVALLVCSAVAMTAAAGANEAPHDLAAPGSPHPTSRVDPTPRQIERFWTPQRMANARPLEMTVGRQGRVDVHLGPRPAAARASYSLVETPEIPPYAWNGRLFVVQAGHEGFCSATAIDSASRRLVLTAGHCVNTGPKDGRPAVWSTMLEFVPGFDLGVAPFGTFVLSGTPLSPPGWTKEGNPDFDLGAFITEPNAAGVALADAVGGGARIVTDLGRRQRFESFAYPGGTERMRTCVSGFAGESPVTAGLRGPDTIGIRCDWPPGASGGGWLIDGGQEIDGLNTYTEISGRQRTFGPYFSASTVGRLVAGL